MVGTMISMLPAVGRDLSKQPASFNGDDPATAPWAELMSVADERYGHQQVSPALVSSAIVPLWAERCYLSARLGPDLQFSAGRAVYPYGGRRTGYVAVSTGGAVHAVRAREPFTLGGDADDPQVGSVRIEVVRPLRELRIVLEDDDVPFGLDLRFEARGPVVPTDRNVIEIRGDVVTDYMNFFQSGWYSGTVTIDGVQRSIEPVLGFRDRGWGMRKHEGAPRRGLILFGAHEFPDYSLWYLLYETASGERVFTNGWLTSESEIIDTITGIEHDLDVDEHGLCTGGRMRFACSSGLNRAFEFNVDARMYLAAGGYAPSQDWPLIGYTRHDTTDVDTVARLHGQNDNGGLCQLDGVAGHGFIETGIGTHPQYQPTSIPGGAKI